MDIRYNYHYHVHNFNYNKLIIWTWTGWLDIIMVRYDNKNNCDSPLFNLTPSQSSGAQGQ